MKKFLIVLLFPLMTAAEPGPVTQYLINEPATFLDIVMVRLERFTFEFERRVGLHYTDNEEMVFFGASVHPQYESDDDKFYIYISAMDSKPDQAQMAEGCRNAMMQMNIWVLKSMHRLFSHAGYEDPTVPADFYQHLNDMFEIRCSFTSSRSTAEGRFWASRKLGLLGDQQITIGKWPMQN